MSQAAASSSPNALPACFPFFLAVTLLQALPPPDPKRPALNRSRIEGALGVVQDLAPRDAVEARLVLQIAILLECTPATNALAAAHQADVKASQLFERHAMSMTSCMLRLMRQLREHRRSREDVAVSGAAPWEYDVVELEAAWLAGAAVTADGAAETVVAAPDAGDAPLAPAVAVEAEAVTVEAAGPTVPLNRQQRRALERMQAKLARRAAVRARGLPLAA